jgi:hypothetical protein
MLRIRERLAAHPEVRTVEVNPRSGSVLVVGARADGLRTALEELVDVVAVVSGERQSEASIQAVVQLVKRADAKLVKLSDGRVSIRWLVPASFIAVALRQLLRQGLTLAEVPWFILLYYGVDSFLKLYPEHAPERSTVTQTTRTMRTTKTTPVRRVRTRG